MGTAISFALERAIVNFFPIILGAGIFAWFFGNRLRSLKTSTRTLIYAFAGTAGGLISYWNFDFPKDENSPVAFALVAIAISVVSYAVIAPIVFLRSRKKEAASSQDA